MAGRDESTRRSATFAFTTQIVSAAFTAALTLYLVRALGPREFGLFSLALGIANFLYLLADFGISQSAARYIAQRHGDRDAGAAALAAGLRLKLILGGGISVALFISAPLIADSYGEPSLTWTLRGIAVALFGQSMMALYTTAFAAIRQMSTNLRIVAGESFIEAAASVAFVAAGLGAAGAAFGRSVGYVAGALIGLAFAMKCFTRRILHIRRSSTRSTPIAGYAAALLIVDGTYALLSTVDVLILGALLGSTAVGIFSAPLRLAALLHYPGLAIAQSVAPRVLRGSDDVAPASLSRVLRFLIPVQAWLAAVVVGWATPIASTLLGSEYSESAMVLRALGLYIFLHGVGPVLSLSANYLGLARQRIPVALVALTANVAIDLLLIPPLGVVGAAIGTSIAYAIYVGGHIAICRRPLELRLDSLALTLIRSGAAFAIASALLMLTAPDDLLDATAVGTGFAAALAFLATLLITRELEVHQVRRATNLVRSRLSRR